jgi:hypothetical protein
LPRKKKQQLFRDSYTPLSKSGLNKRGLSRSRSSKTKRILKNLKTRMMKNHLLWQRGVGWVASTQKEVDTLYVITIPLNLNPSNAKKASEEGERNRDP